MTRYDDIHPLGERLANVARYLAEQGFRVFPLAPKSKVPHKGSSGLKDASSDCDKIRSWWADCPDSNLAIATGPQNNSINILVLDWDVKDERGGLISREALLKKHGSLPQTLCTYTPSGGYHEFFIYPKGISVRNSSDQIAQGLDVRGEGGYVVFGPSVLPGGMYQFSKNPKMSSIALAPQWLLDLLAEHKGSPSTKSVSPIGECITKGQRNNKLTSFAGTMRRRGAGEKAIAAALLELNYNQCMPPLSDREVLSIARSVSQYPVGKIPKEIESGIREHEEEIEEEEWLTWKPFPSNLLPNQAARYVLAYAAALNCDPSMIAIPLLAVLGASVGNSYRIQLKKSWHEPATLWTLIINPSGTLKSPALNAALAPVLDIEREEQQAYDAAWKQYESELDQYKSLPKDKRENKSKPISPTRNRFRVGDTTVESIARVHAENQRGLLLARDELGGWLGGFDRYASGEADIQSWIEMYEGRQIQIDRKTSTPPVINIHSPAVCVTGTIQPGVLTDKLKNKHFEAGFATRLLMAYPPERQKRWTDADVSQEVKADYFRLVRSLYALPMNTKARSIGLDPEARELFKRFYDDNAELTGKLPDGVLCSVLSKIEAIAARLALILHLADECSRNQSCNPTPVSADAMQRAIKLSCWFRYEIARIYQRMNFYERTVSPDVKYLANLPKPFTWREVAEAWKVERREAFKIIKRLTRQGFVAKISHGQYRVERNHTMHFIHFEHFAYSESEDSA